MIWKRNIGKKIFIIWVDYTSNVDKKEKTQTEQINEAI